MAIFKNQIPILEFDTEQSAVIMPGHHSDYNFPQKAVMLFMEPEIDDFVAQNECEVVGKFVSVTKEFFVYKTIINGVDIAFVQAPLGGAGAVQIMEQLIAGGVKEIIAAGCCGALVEDTEGSFFVPTAALRQEGTSYHYLPPSREIELDPTPIKAICKVLENAELNYKTCKTWTTDGFYRETKEMVRYRKSEGYSVVEMECASMAACAKMRGVLFGQVLFTADSLADVDAHDIRNWGNDFFCSSYENCNGSDNGGVIMRTENEMYDLILGIAKSDVRIKAVYMNGSRTNENVPKDIFQDYDIVYVVENTQSFIEDKNWINLFGEILYMQYPDENPYYPSDKQNSYGWLMQFADGIRIDLTVQSINYALQHIQDDKLCRILLDKENILPEIETATDCQYWVKEPTEEQYLAVCNEFWWCTNNIAKGLWREEIPYVQDMANYIVRNQLITMLNWKVGILTGWSVSTGKSSKYLYKWLSEEEWQMLMATYFDGNVDNAWKSILGMCEFFGITAKFVGEKLGWEYNEKEGKAAQAFLEYVHQLPKN